MINSDAETGMCAESNDIMSPAHWDYDGPVTQISYEASPVKGLFGPNLTPK